MTRLEEFDIDKNILAFCSKMFDYINKDFIAYLNMIMQTRLIVSLKVFNNYQNTLAYHSERMHSHVIVDNSLIYLVV